MLQDVFKDTGQTQEFVWTLSCLHVLYKSVMTWPAAACDDVISISKFLPASEGDPTMT